MLSQYNKSSAQVNSSATKNKINNIQTSAVAPKLLYRWAEQLFYDRKIKASVLHTLKGAISCAQMDKATIKQINEARTRSASRKFAQSDPVSDKTVERHLCLLDKLGILNKKTETDCWYSRNTITFNIQMTAENKLVTSPQDIMSPPITLATSYISKINTKNECMEEKNQNLNLRFKIEKSKAPTKLTFNPQKQKSKLSETQLVQLAILASMGTWEMVALGWLDKYPEHVLNDAIHEAKTRAIKNKGAYVRALIEGLNKRNIQPQANMQNTEQNYPAPAAIMACLMSGQPKSGCSDKKTVKTHLNAIKDLLGRSTKNQIAQSMPRTAVLQL